MNLILFDRSETERPLPKGDPRAVHLLTVLRRGCGDSFDAGIADGPRGKATVDAVDAHGITLSFAWGPEPRALDPIHLLVAVPRPQTARKILGEAAALGIASIRLFPSEKGEAGYASSSLWSSGEWRQRLMDGTAQAFDTRLPQVLHAASLAEALAALPQGPVRTALDNYEATQRLVAPSAVVPTVLAFGPERGWSAQERDLLRAAGFGLAHLGTRVLRTETAVVAAVAIVKAVA